MLHKIQRLLEKISEAALPERQDIESVLSIEDSLSLQGVFSFADSLRAETKGRAILLRAIIEFSNVCRNRCAYCGISKNNPGLPRYRLSREEIMESVSRLHAFGIGTVILQSGEDPCLDGAWLASVIQEIKSRFGLIVTLSVGERSFKEYALWRGAGADRYLLKIETTDEALYRSLHPAMSFTRRMRLISELRSLGYETGSGNIAGLPGQTLGMIARDILFFKKMHLEMVGINSFIPHPDTPLAYHRPGSSLMALKIIALTRILLKEANIPATTALAHIGGSDARKDALMAGANVLMLNFTPEKYKPYYTLYPYVLRASGSVAGYKDFLAETAQACGRSIAYAEKASREREQVCA
jgi:biotin synthase